jgi:3,4-dihydroxy 2-butanone 4-phosphate synthase
MASGIQVLAYAQTHQLTVITIEELLQYRIKHGV